MGLILLILYKMHSLDIKAEKLWLIENLLKVQDEAVLHRVRVLLEKFTTKKQVENVVPMDLDTFYNKIEESEKAFERGDIISQDQLKEEIKTWQKL